MTRKNTFFNSLSFTLLLLWAPLLIQAQGSGFGLGIIVGEPTGLSAKAWIGEGSAVDFAAAWSLEGRDYFQLHADYLRHANVIDVNKGFLPFYYGIGARMVILEDKFRREDEEDILFGLRIPLGITYLFAGAPLDIFAELVPVIELFPSTDFDVDGGVGIRYYF